MTSSSFRCYDVVARGKFVSSAKLLAVVPSISQLRRFYHELHENEDRLETGGKAVVKKPEIQSFSRIEI